jgi:copper homeostasis protein
MPFQSDKILLEVPVETLDDAIAANRGGANRLELCSALEVGGLTPNQSLLNCIKEQVNLPVVAMIRPRSGGCHYSSNDFQVMLKQRDEMISAGASGIVFGFLDRDGHIDEPRLKEFISAIPPGIETVFHRAFDLVENAIDSLELLIASKVTRILTSGLKPSAPEGVSLIKNLIEIAGDQIEIIVGGGVRLENVEEIVAATGTNQIHASCRATAQDRSPRLRPEIQFGLPELPPETVHRRTDAGLVACMRAALMR